MTGIRLLDVNVLVALLWPRQRYHLAAQVWFARVRDDGWATCPITQLGVVRVLSTRSVSQGALNILTATVGLDRILTEGMHVWWPADIDLVSPPFRESLDHVQGPGQLTDRYLLALAAANDGVLATFDRSIGAALPANSSLLPHLEVIPL